MEGPLTRGLIILWLAFVGTAEAKKPQKPRINPRDLQGLVPRGNNPLAKAEFYMERGRFRDAARQYSQILQRNPNSVRAQLGRGRAYARIGRCEKALEDLAVARTAVNVWSADGASQEGYCLARIGDTWQALATYEEAARLDEEAPIHKFRLAFAQLNVGEADAAYATLEGIKNTKRNKGMRGVLEAWLDYETDGAPIAYHLDTLDGITEESRANSVRLQRKLLEGWSYMDDGDLLAADETFYDAVSTSLQHLRAAVSRAEARRRLGRAEGSLSILNRQVLLADTAVSARAIKARAYVDLGQLDDARNELAGLEDTHDEAVVASFWYLARAEGDEDAMAQHALRWEGFAHPARRTLEQLIPVEGLLPDEPDEQESDTEEAQ